MKFLQETINSLSKNRSKSIIGEKAEVLVEGVSSKFENMVTGRTTNNKIVNIPGHNKLVGELLNIQITDFNNKSLKRRDFNKLLIMDKISITLEPVDNNRLMNLCGPLNNNIKELEMRFNVEINHRGGSFYFVGAKKEY